MAQVETKYFGTMSYSEESVFDFPSGLPAFEHATRFVLIESPENTPLVFLQSLADPKLCFLAFPILVLDRDYQLGISPEDLAALNWDAIDVESNVDGDPYQRGSLASLRTPADLLSRLTSALGELGDDLVIFCGTVPLLTGEFHVGRRWLLQLKLDSNTCLTHSYEVLPDHG